MIARLGPGDRYSLMLQVGNMHVWASNREVIRAIWDRWPARNKAKPKIWRKAAYRHALYCHKQNLKTYVDVMRGM